MPEIFMNGQLIGNYDSGGSTFNAPNVTPLNTANAPLNAGSQAVAAGTPTIIPSSSKKAGIDFNSIFTQIGAGATALKPVFDLFSAPVSTVKPTVYEVQSLKTIGATREANAGQVPNISNQVSTENKGAQSSQNKPSGGFDWSIIVIFAVVLLAIVLIRKS